MQLNAFLWTIRSKLFKLQGFERLYRIKLHNKWVIGGNRVLPVIWVISSLHWRVQNLAGKLEQQAAFTPHITTGYDTACQHFPLGRVNRPSSQQPSGGSEVSGILTSLLTKQSQNFQLTPPTTQTFIDVTRVLRGATALFNKRFEQLSRSVFLLNF